MKNLAVFGSGNGSNAKNICDYFSNNSRVNVSCIVTNKKDAYIITHAKKYDVPVVYTTMQKMNEFDQFKKTLDKYNIDFIVLAGFLLKIPSKIINSYSKKIINIHPSLLPKYGGKGMYGKNIHRSVIKNKEKESGITIHFVNQNYDEGEIILQKKCFLSSNETVISLEQKIRRLESEYFPKIIEKLILK